MAVIINNMKMPTSCVVCPFINGIHKSKDNDGVKTAWYGCRVIAGNGWQPVDELTKRRSDCPLERY